MLKNNIISEQEIFKVQNFDDVMIDYRKIGDTDIPLVVLDNFYVNPEGVRDFALSLPFTKSRYVCNASPGTRVRIELDVRHLRELCYHLLKLPKWSIKPTTCQAVFTRMRSDESLRPEQTNPHIDGIDMLNAAAVIYLNDNEECAGGTAFYRHKETGLDIVQRNSELNSTYDNYPQKRKDYGDLITESNEEWEMIDFVDMKFNRMLVYPPNVFHSGYMDRNDFVDYDRITQLFFF